MGVRYCQSSQHLTSVARSVLLPGLFGLSNGDCTVTAGTVLELFTIQNDINSRCCWPCSLVKKPKNSEWLRTNRLIMERKWRENGKKISQRYAFEPNIRKELNQRLHTFSAKPELDIHDRVSPEVVHVHGQEPVVAIMWSSKLRQVRMILIQGYTVVFQAWRTTVHGRVT